MPVVVVLSSKAEICDLGTMGVCQRFRFILVIEHSCLANIWNLIHDYFFLV